MRRRIQPLRERTAAASKDVYRELYDDVEDFIGEKLKWRGIHTLIHQRLAPRLAGARLIDLGCSFGRMSLLAERSGAWTLGVDMIPRAVEVARVLGQATGARRATFECSDIESLRPPGEPFDFAVLAQVLEQLMDPDAMMDSVRSLLRPQATLVIASTNESNPRGDVVEVLTRLFALPTTLADVRVVHAELVAQLAARHGFVVEEILGCCYQRAWGALGGEDLKRRVGRALEDAGESWARVELSREAFEAWVDRRVRERRAVLDDWIARGILRPMPERPPFAVDEDVLRAAGLGADLVRAYLAPDFSMEPHYCPERPYSLMGGQAIYVLRRS